MPRYLKVGIKLLAPRDWRILKFPALSQVSGVGISID